MQSPQSLNVFFWTCRKSRQKRIVIFVFSVFKKIHFEHVATNTRKTRKTIRFKFYRLNILDRNRRYDSFLWIFLSVLRKIQISSLFFTKNFVYTYLANKKKLTFLRESAHFPDDNSENTLSTGHRATCVHQKLPWFNNSGPSPRWIPFKTIIL